MSVASVANHVEHQINPLVEQRQERQSASSAAARESSANNAVVAQDTYTPSASNPIAEATAQAAGIFQLNQAAANTNAALAQPAPTDNPNAAPPQATHAATSAAPINPDPAQTPAAANSGAYSNASQQLSGGSAVQTAISGATGSATAQGQVQSLNTALAALGLSNYDIQQIDRIAAVIQNFNPSAYTDLVNQFEEQASEARQLASPPASANAATANAAAPANSNSAANANVPANGGGYQLQGISITYAGLPATSNSGATPAGQGTAVSGAQSAPTNLQIEQAQFTLTNGNGQTIQVQAPQQSTNAGTPNLQSTHTQPAVA